MPKRQTFCLKEERNKALSPSVCSSSAPSQHRRCEEGSRPAFLFCLAHAEASATHVLGRKQMPNESLAQANVKNNVKAASQPESFICLQSLRIWLSWNPSQALHPTSSGAVAQNRAATIQIHIQNSRTRQHRAPGWVGLGLSWP